MPATTTIQPQTDVATQYQKLLMAVRVRLRCHEIEAADYNALSDKAEPLDSFKHRWKDAALIHERSANRLREILAEHK